MNTDHLKDSGSHPTSSFNSVSDFLEIFIIIFITGVPLILLLINAYLRLGSEHNETLIFNQYLIIPLFICSLVILIMRVFNSEICGGSRYPTHFFIIILILLGIMIFAVLQIWDIFPQARGKLSTLSLTLLTLLMIAIGIIPFIVFYNELIGTVHNIMISFILIPISVVLLSLVILDHLPLKLLNIYQFDISLFSHQLKVASLLTFVGILVGLVITIIYIQLLERIEWMDTFLQWFSTITLIALISFCIIKDREIFLLLAVSFW